MVATPKAVTSERPKVPSRIFEDHSCHWCDLHSVSIEISALQAKRNDDVKNLSQIWAVAPALAEGCFSKALTAAWQQRALLWELRSALHLARLRVGQKRPEDAWHILAPVYGQFVEGFETADLRAAKLMLESLSENRPLSAGSTS